MKLLNILLVCGLTSVFSLTGALCFGYCFKQNANAQETVISTENGGLISPKANDPVIYTTESGLEIKYGNISTAIALGGGNEKGSFENMPSGNLNGFPYFTTQSGSATYSWVIIGRNSGISSNIIDVSYDTLANWRAKTTESPTYKNFFESTYETYSPAGSLITNHNVLNNYTARKLESIYSNFTALKTNDSEIPTGCVLVVSNDCVATGAYNLTHGTFFGYASSSAYGSQYYRYSSTYYGDETIAVVMENYYKNKNFGLDKVYNNIQARTISTYSYYLDEKNNANTLKTFSTTVHLFPFGMNSSSSYYWANYLTANQVKCSTSQWVRGRVDTTDAFTGTGPYYMQNSTLNASGSYENAYVNSTTVGYRPAFVLKIT